MVFMNGRRSALASNRCTSVSVVPVNLHSEACTINGNHPVESFSIITVEPNDLMIPIHNRMPLTLEEKNCAAWLNPKTSLDDLSGLLKPYLCVVSSYLRISGINST